MKKSKKVGRVIELRKTTPETDKQLLLIISGTKI